MFRKKDKMPLEEASNLVHLATEIAWAYKRDKDYLPTEEALDALGSLEKRLWEAHLTIGYIHRKLSERFENQES